jgi:hypothetical protein
VGFIGTLNPETQERLRRLAEKLDGLASSNATPRPKRADQKRRCGAISEAVAQVLVDAGGPMRMVEIHAEVEALLSEVVPRSTVKDALVSNSHGTSPRFVRIARGRYRLRG